MIYSRFPKLMFPSPGFEEDFNTESCTIQGGSISVQQIVAMYSRGEMVRPLQKPIDEGSELRPCVVAKTKEEALKMSQEFTDYFIDKINQPQQQQQQQTPQEPQTAQNPPSATPEA